MHAILGLRVEWSKRSLPKNCVSNARHERVLKSLLPAVTPTKDVLLIIFHSRRSLAIVISASVTHFGAPHGRILMSLFPTVTLTMDGHSLELTVPYLVRDLLHNAVDLKR